MYCFVRSALAWFCGFCVELGSGIFSVRSDRFLRPGPPGLKKDGEMVIAEKRDLV